MGKRCDRCNYYTPDIIMEHQALLRQLAQQGTESTMSDLDSDGITQLKELFDAMQEISEGQMCSCNMYQSINMEKIV
jgi:aerobic-type carbon monoxide dehydrogenase small subunit (CoxS/CutS family)|tara:strand:+ start:1054 stop:1284 length:231 start_codon:yes stop_codon:yes gene_type:complete